MARTKALPMVAEKDEVMAPLKVEPKVVLREVMLELLAVKRGRKTWGHW